MIHKPLHFLQDRLAETPARPRAVPEERLPVGNAITIIAGASVVLWSLIATAIKSVI